MFHRIFLVVAVCSGQVALASEKDDLAEGTVCEAIELKKPSSGFFRLADYNAALAADDERVRGWRHNHFEICVQPEGDIVLFVPAEILNTAYDALEVSRRL